MNETVKKRIRVGHFGLDERSVQMLDLVFKHRTNGMCELVEVEDSELVIFDMDNTDAEEQWSEFRNEYPRLAIIVISDRDLSIDDVAFLKKPLKVNALIDAITKLTYSELAAQTKALSKHVVGGHAAEITDTAKSFVSRVEISESKKRKISTNHNEETNNYYDPALFMQGYMREIIDSTLSVKKVVEIKFLKDRVIIYDSIKHQIHTNLTESQFRHLGIIKLDNDESVYPNYKLHEAQQLEQLLYEQGGKLKKYSKDSFMWDLTLATAKGRLPQNIKLEDPVYLDHWPNLSRLMITNDCFRIVALLVKSPRSSLDVAAELNIELGSVLDLVSACCAIGLAGQAKRQSDVMFEPELETDKNNRGIFKSILRKLKGSRELGDGVAEVRA